MGSLLTGPSLHCRLSAEASVDSGHRGLGLIVALFVLRPPPVGLIRFRGHVPKGGYDVQNGINEGRETGATTVQ